MAENMFKSMAEIRAYPDLAIIEERCLLILCNLFNTPEGIEYIGSSTVGSSEAVLIAGLAMK